jgi:predicted transcriptional regulator
MTIELKPELERRLRHQAEASGLPFDAFLERILEQSAIDGPLVQSASSSFVNRNLLKPTAAQRAEAFERWARDHESEVVLTDEAMDRASFYGERG